MKQCNHDRVYACRAEYPADDLVTAFFLICAKCARGRTHSRTYLGAFRDWLAQPKEKYPEGFCFTILAGPSGNEKALKETVVEAIQELAEKEKEAAS